MLAALWAALQRIGWALPTLRPSLVGIHGPLMISGVLGTLISLERAVALAALAKKQLHWSYLAPLLSGIGGVLLAHRRCGCPWKVQEVPTPKPGADQVLLRIRASGLCYTDVHITQGHLPASSFPRTLGHEPVGEIVEVGPGVRTRKVGDRVGVPWVQTTCVRCDACRRGKAEFCPEQIGTGVQIDGSHAEFMLAWAEGTVLLPDGLSWEQAAPIFCAGYTVYSGLRIADPKPHERVAVLGIGGLGHLAIQYAKAAGFGTFAVTKTKDKGGTASFLTPNSLRPDTDQPRWTAR